MTPAWVSNKKNNKINSNNKNKMEKVSQKNKVMGARMANVMRLGLGIFARTKRGWPTPGFSIFICPFVRTPVSLDQN